MSEGRIRTQVKPHGDTAAYALAGKPRSRVGGKRFARPARKARAAAHPAWTKAVTPALTPTATTDDALAIIGTSCRTHWRANLAAALDGNSPEGIHQVRVSLRRLRSTLSLFKKYIPETQRTALNREAKWLLAQLGPVRDLDVFIHTLAEPFAEKVSDDARIALLIRAARTERIKAHDAAVTALKSHRAGRLAARLDAWFSGRGWTTRDSNGVRDGRKEHAADFAQKTLNKRLRNMLAAYGDVKELSVDERHELRIAAKKVRYGIEFLSSLLPAKRVARLSALLKQLQDCLGHLNDLDVAERTLKMLSAHAGDAATRTKIAASGRTISRWHKHAAKAAEPKAARIWRKVRNQPAF